MSNLLAKLRDCALFAIISILVLVISLLSIIAPDQSFSAKYGDYLSPAPRFDLKKWWNGSFAASYDDYSADQLWHRDKWLTGKSFAEFLMLKTENNGVAYGKDAYLFSKFTGYTAETMINNINAIDMFAYSSVSNVHVMIIPSSSYPMVDFLPPGLAVADQGYYISEMNQYLGNYATVVNVKDILAVNADNYIYYRTDPHWTTYGAYLAYSQYTSSTDLRPLRYSSANTVKVKNYLGTNYSRSKPFSVTPDFIEYFDFPGSVTVDQTEYEGLYDYRKFEGVDKYSAFLHGSHAYSVIRGEHSNDKLSNIVVISDSFAYSFIPMLTQHYNEIILIDLRFYLDSFDEIRTTRYDDILIMLGFDALCSNTNLMKIEM